MRSAIHLCLAVASCFVVRARLNCHSISTLATDAWCNENCNTSPPTCPPDICKCDSPPSPPTPPPPAPPPSPVEGNTWVVLAAGSNTYWNYRHQADICHAYQIVKSHGVAPERIITLMYDDAAHDPANPFPGKLFNQPNGNDVYAGCAIDYRADALSPSLFLNVLLGKADAVQSSLRNSSNGNGKVLNSGPEDRVFVYFADHGGSGMIMFPGGAISSSDLIDTLKQMHTKQMYKELVFYLDTCKSGSMFTQLPTDIGVLAVASARPDEDANAIWCYAPDNIIQGRSIGSCLGDATSVGWMMDSDTHFDETLNTQFATMKSWSLTNRCSPIPCSNMPCMYGDTGIASEPVGNFQGQRGSMEATRLDTYTIATQGINARDVKLHLLRQRLQEANDTNARAEARKRLRVEEAQRQRVDEFFKGLAQVVCEPQICDAESLFGKATAVESTYEGCHPKTVVDLSCHKELLDTIDSSECDAMKWDDYSAKYAELLADFCNTAKPWEQLVRHIRSACQSSSTIV